MATGVASWSQTAANNASGDSAVNWAEGQSPSSVNDSARAMMASVAKYRDDISGGITTGGTATAYTVTSNQGFASLSALDKQIIAFVPHATNTGAPTLNVDGTGARSLQPTQTDAFAAGDIVAGTPYVATYSLSLNMFLVHNAGQFAAMTPLGTVLDYAGGTAAPNSRYALCYGQAISRTTYAGLFGIMGTSFGTGDGSTTYTLPDLRGRFVAGYDSMGGSAANRMTLAGGGVAGNFSQAGGVEKTTLSNSNLPVTNLTWTSTNTYSPGTLNSSQSNILTSNASGATAGGSGLIGGGTTSASISVPSFSPTGTINSFGGGQSFPQIPPCLVLSKIIRIL